MKSLTDAVEAIQKINITRDILPEDSGFPNNRLLPMLHYAGAVREIVEHTVRDLLETNGWSNSWVGDIIARHHYHSITHEVLVALQGTAQVQFGGPNGLSLTFEAGDVVIIPAGVAHKKIEATDGFVCLGAYPGGADYDIRYGEEGDRATVEENIRRVALPGNDPIYGSDGPLVKHWAPSTVR
jgi:uncharacterized protein YjlB